jgi:lipoteichoic acid synthase
MPKKNSRKKRKQAALKQQTLQKKSVATNTTASEAVSPEDSVEAVTPVDSGEAVLSADSVSTSVVNSAEAVTAPTSVIHNTPPSHKSFSKFPFGTTIYFIGLMLYLELLFHGYHFGLGTTNTIRIVLFSIILGGMMSVIVGLFPKVVNHILTIAATVCLSLLFIIQFLYYSVFQHYLAFWGMLQYTNQAMDNFDTVWLNIRQHAGMILLFLLPIVLISVFAHRILSLRRRRWSHSLILLGSVLLLYIGMILGMKLTASDTYDAYEMYRYYTSVDMTVEQLGVCETLIVDVRQGIASQLGIEQELLFHTASEGTNHTTAAASDGSANPDAGTSSDANEDSSTEETKSHTDTSPNVLAIDFDEIAENSGNDAIASLCEYFDDLTPTRKNEYTGMFEGYNVIEITAEGFSGYALESGLFPTLSMMADEGFVFENYYSPLWYGSTLGGEYANLMGSMPKNGGYLSLSHAAAYGNTLLFSLGNQLKSIGYETYAFHNNSYTYYDRNLTHPALGYTWIANGSGLEPQVNEYGTTLWPQSDLVMIQDTFEDYTTKQPFHLYYMTVSGHVVYSFSDNAMSQKNKAIVENLEYSETTKAYLAAQYELELAMRELIQELKDNDLYDNTIIILAGDHVPYDNMEILDELAGYELEDSFEAYESSLIIWSGAMEEPVKVDKVCSSIDILPTVSNLLGLDYDSRLIIGQDILSDSDGLVMFANRSFITDRYSYNTSTGVLTSFDGSSISDDELAEMRSYVSNKFTAADAITEYDFYRYVVPCSYICRTDIFLHFYIAAICRYLSTCISRCIRTTARQHRHCHDCCSCHTYHLLHISSHSSFLLIHPFYINQNLSQTDFSSGKYQL